MANNTVQLHRILKTTPDKVFRAFSNADAFCSWLPPFGFISKIHHWDFCEKGSYKMSFLNFSTGNSHSFEGEFLEIQTNELIKYTDRFDDPNLQGEIITKVQLKKVLCGDGTAYHTGRNPFRHSHRNVLLRMAGIFRKTKETG